MGNSSQRIEGSFITVAVGASPISAYKRIKLGTDGKYVVAGLTDYGDAVIERDAKADEVGVPARLVNAEGTQFGIAAGAIASAGLTLYSAASGEVSTTQGTNAVIVGKSSAAASNGDITTYIGKSVA
jgi:hypothetical protein